MLATPSSGWRSLYGDVNRNGTVHVTDAVLVQAHREGLEGSRRRDAWYVADVDGSNFLIKCCRRHTY